MRTYSEQEVADIIARAAERQAASSRASDGVGLTLDEIARLGADAGLDPADLRAAAAELDRGGIARQASQTDTHVVVERWVDAPLTDEAWEDTVALLRDRFGPSAAAMLGRTPGGDVQQVGGACEWSGMTGSGLLTTATVSPRGERTRIRITQHVGLANSRTEGLALGGILAVVAAAITGAALGSAAGVGVPVLILAVVAAFAASFAAASPTITALDRGWRARKLARLDTLAGDIAGILVAPTTAPAEPMAPLDAPLRDAFEALAPDEAEGEHAAAPRSRGRA